MAADCSVQVIYTAHYSQNVIVDREHLDADVLLAGDGSGGERELEGGVVDPGEVASAGRLMLLRRQGEGVDVDSLGRDVGVVLVRLDEVEVGAVALGEPVVTVELELGGLGGVGTSVHEDGGAEG